MKRILIYTFFLNPIKILIKLGFIIYNTCKNLFLGIKIIIFLKKKTFLELFIYTNKKINYKKKWNSSTIF